MKYTLRTNNKQQLSEISQYVKDLEKMTVLRDKAAREATNAREQRVPEEDNHSLREWKRYDDTIECMQLVLVHLNERLL